MAEVARIGRQDLVLTLENEAKAGLRNEIGPLINAFHAQTVPMQVTRFALRLHDAQNRLVGGLSGVLNWGWLFVEALWVDPGLRGQGAGRVLMARAERIARDCGCHSAWLDTFQARPFYEAIGYQVFAVLEHYPGAQSRAFLRKPLAAPREGKAVPEDPTAGQVLRITREGLSDGSLLAAARQAAPPGTVFLTDGEIAADLDRALAQATPGEDVWLFGYGSLMWNPAIEFAERRAGAVRGWHRRYCLWLRMGRGTSENPGLMLALDAGGACGGMLFRLPAASARSELLLVWRRELLTGAYRSRWVTALTPAGPVRAVTFVINRAHPGYAGRLDEAVIAERLASASGSLGSCATYLDETIASLHALGLRDVALERLQAKVRLRKAVGV